MDWWRLLLLPLPLLLLAGGDVGPQEAEAVCQTASDNNMRSELVGKHNLSVWLCGSPSYFNTGGRVHLSDCPANEIDDGQACSTYTVDSGTTPLTTCTVAMTPPFNSVEIKDFDGVAKYFDCIENMEWLSGRKGRISQCFRDAWTPIYDICDEACSMPRDCAEIDKLRLPGYNMYTVVPSGDPRGPNKTVTCLFNGYTAVSEVTSSRSVTVRNGIEGHGELNYGDQHTSIYPYFIGIRHLADLTWDGPNYRPLEIRFTFEFHGRDPREATYDNLVINRTEPYHIISLGTYHGTAGDGLRDCVGKDFLASDHNWWWDNTKVNVSARKWASFSNIAKFNISVRPMDYDRETNCPPQFGWEPSWFSHTKVHIPMTRSVGTVVKYRCEGELFMAGNGTTVAQKHRHENASCVNGTDGSLVWDNEFFLPCELTCPDNYTTTVDGTSCVRFSDDEAVHGITTASLKCHRELASMAVWKKYGNHSNILDDQYYYTAHVRNGNIFEGNGLQQGECSPNENCEAVSHQGCLTLAFNSVGSQRWRAQECVRNQTRYICMRPAYCHGSYKPYKGLCYKVVPASSYSRDTEKHETNHLRALNYCANEGASLAYPESIDELVHLATLIREEGAWDSTEKNVLIGLNKRGGDWTAGGVYSPDSEVIDLAENVSTKYWMRYLTIRNDNTITLTPARLITNIGVSVHYAICQLYGLTGCVDVLPEPTVNMSRNWPSNSSYVDVTVRYICYPGYFTDGDVSLTQQKIHCGGPFGLWGLRELKDCIAVDVCTETSLEEVSPYLIVENSTNHHQLNGTITFTCPANMSTSSGETSKNVTCKNMYNNTYSYFPKVVAACDVCLGQPETENATTAWSSSTTNYSLNDAVNVICNENHFVDLLSKRQSLSCSYTGWTNTTPCYEGCGNPPPNPGANMTRDNFTNNAIGAEVSYTCDDGLSIHETYPDLTNTITLTCKDHVWLPNDTKLECAKVCADDPPSPISVDPYPNATSTWDNYTRVSGTQVQLTCPSGYLFANQNSTITVTCEEDGNWTLVNTSLICRILATDPPQPPGSEYSGPVRPYWQWDILNYTCPGDMMSPTGTNATSLTFNGTEWVLEEPDFQCLNVCLSDPLTPDPPIKTTWNGRSRTVNTMVELSCPDGYVFTNLNSSVNLTCDNNSRNWTDIDTSILICRIVAIEGPPQIPDSEYSGPKPPHWQWDVLNYTCYEDLMSPAETNTTSVTFNGTEWVLEDPDFKCLNVCGSPPPASNRTTYSLTAAPVTGTMASYICLGGFLVYDPSTLGNDNTTTSLSNDTTTLNITCLDSGWSLSDIPVCKMCTTPPPASDVGVTISYKGVDEWGAVATYTCETKFVDDNKTISVTCLEGTSNWTVTNLPHCIGKVLAC
ncbi:uncharacterized protein LOC121858775 isoform X2 [Homarus americanus]|uniref:uncharacterized protein LOC121858775 isoform X2 n=1 Tax=Homarus americanus TaxID=6706 RepID=UPI001C44C2D7|nr:uncharacterized protein LOC121858775 isoform X2 [Homarus americanus]